MRTKGQKKQIRHNEALQAAAKSGPRLSARVVRESEHVYDTGEL